jgi:hypothetical protein
MNPVIAPPGRAMLGRGRPVCNDNLRAEPPIFPLPVHSIRGGKAQPQTRRGIYSEGRWPRWLASATHKLPKTPMITSMIKKFKIIISSPICSRDGRGRLVCSRLVGTFPRARSPAVSGALCTWI